MGSIIPMPSEEGHLQGLLLYIRAPLAAGETFPIEDTLGRPRGPRSRGRHSTHLPDKDHQKQRTHTHKHTRSQKQIPTLNALSSQTAGFVYLYVLKQSLRDSDYRIMTGTHSLGLEPRLPPPSSHPRRSSQAHFPASGHTPPGARALPLTEARARGGWRQGEGCRK